MKKFIGIILCLNLLFVVSACDKIPMQDELTTEVSSLATQQNDNGNREKTDESANQISAERSSQNVGGAVIQPQKYRARFYTLYAPFVQLVGKDVCREWMETIDYSPNASSMVMLQFVQHFNISREQFDKANLKTARIIQDQLDGRPCFRPRDYANQEDDEIYNADIIYTFDEEIINAYYLGPDYPYLFDFEFDEAVAAGEYTSQTEEWVDVDEMEAEILAKYGSLD